MPSPETDDRATLWQELRSWPRPVQYGAAGLAAAIFGASFVIGPLYSPDLPGESEWPEGTLPESAPVGTAEAGAADETEPELPEGIDVHQGDPRWTADIEADGDEVAQVDQGTLRLTDSKLELERDGERVWSHAWEEYAPEIGVADGVVVISQSLDEISDEEYEWPGRQDTVALDLDTGEEVWHDQEASFVTVYADAVLMTECTGEQDAGIGDCTLYSRNPADLSVQWSTPTYASAQSATGTDWIAGPAPDRILIESYPNGHEDRTVGVYEQGERLASVETSDSAALSGDMLILYADYDDNPADGCTSRVSGYRLGDAEPAWEVEAMTRKTADFSSCGGLPTTEAQDGKLPLTIDGVPSMVDATTGESAWEAPEEGQAIALSPEADTLIAADWESEEDNLVAYDTANGEERWRASTALGSGGSTSVAGSTLWLYGDASTWGWSSYDVFAYDLATGEGVALPGTAAYFAPGEIVTSTGDYGAATLNAWPTDLW